MYKINFYVPEDHVEIVKTALFEAGAGRIGLYTHCAWQVKGEGQFMPLPGSHAFIGQVNQIEKVIEYKVEMVCSDEYLEAAMRALKKSHPYETPAYQVFRCEELSSLLDSKKNYDTI